jgi:hypothetical protein
MHQLNKAALLGGAQYADLNVTDRIALGFVELDKYKESMMMSTVGGIKYCSLVYFPVTS